MEGLLLQPDFDGAFELSLHADLLSFGGFFNMA